MLPFGKLEYVLCMTTTNREDVAVKIKNEVLSKRLCACVTILPLAKSFFHWREKVESEEEFVMLFKTRIEKVEELKKEVLVNHNYEVAEFIAIPIIDGSIHYFDWIDREVGKGETHE